MVDHHFPFRQWLVWLTLHVQPTWTMSKVGERPLIQEVVRPWMGTAGLRDGERVMLHSKFEKPRLERTSLLEGPGNVFSPRGVTYFLAWGDLQTCWPNCWDPMNRNPNQRESKRSKSDIKIWGFPEMGVPQSGWFMREHPIKMDDDWGYPHFRKPPYRYPIRNWAKLLESISFRNLLKGDYPS